MTPKWIHINNITVKLNLVCFHSKCFTLQGSSIHPAPHKSFSLSLWWMLQDQFGVHCVDRLMSPGWSRGLNNWPFKWWPPHSASWAIVASGTDPTSSGSLFHSCAALHVFTSAGFSLKKTKLCSGLNWKLCKRQNETVWCTRCVLRVIHSYQCVFTVLENVHRWRWCFHYSSWEAC